MSHPSDRWPHGAPLPPASRPPAPDHRQPPRNGVRLPPASRLISATTIDAEHPAILQETIHAGPAPVPQRGASNLTTRMVPPPRPDQYASQHHRGVAPSQYPPYGHTVPGHHNGAGNGDALPPRVILQHRPHVQPPPSAVAPAAPAGYGIHAPGPRAAPPMHRTQYYWHKADGFQQLQSPRSSTPSSSVSETPSKVCNIPNLLVGSGKEEAIEEIKFSLRVRQQPKAARACGSGERDRRNIDPPPIVQLHIEAPGLTEDEVTRYLRYEGYVMNCLIYDSTCAHDASQMPTEYRSQRRLTGSLVGTPFFGKDERGKEGCFFPFSDLSVRTLGSYCLKFNLIMLDTSRLAQNRHFPILAETFSEPFSVYTAKDFPGINESSGLVRSLREQGCIISIKKGNDKKKKKKEDADEQDRSDDEALEEELVEEEDEDGGQGKRKRSLSDA